MSCILLFLLSFLVLSIDYWIILSVGILVILNFFFLMLLLFLFLSLTSLLSEIFILFTLFLCRVYTRPRQIFRPSSTTNPSLSSITATQFTRFETIYYLFVCPRHLVFLRITWPNILFRSITFFQNSCHSSSLFLPRICLIMINKYDRYFFLQSHIWKYIHI